MIRPPDGVKPQHGLSLLLVSFLVILQLLDRKLSSLQFGMAGIAWTALPPTNPHSNGVPTVDGRNPFRTT